MVDPEKYHRIERKYGEFQRIFTLPTLVDGTRVVAELKNGTLTAMLPKHTVAMPRQIEVKVT